MVNFPYAKNPSISFARSVEDQGYGDFLSISNNTINVDVSLKTSVRISTKQGRYQVLEDELLIVVLMNMPGYDEICKSYQHTTGVLNSSLISNCA